MSKSFDYEARRQNWIQWFVNCTNTQIQGTFDKEKERLKEHLFASDMPMTNVSRQILEDSRIAVSQARIEAAKRGLILDE